jgi:shikimate dehydrogenase
MRTFGLIGFPLSHSFSKKYFTAKFEKEQISDCQYELFPIASADEMPSLIDANPSLCGLNVTIPHKLKVMELLNEIDEAAIAIGAVNCISIDQRSAQPFLKGYNTDAYGFEESLKPLLTDNHKKALIFGDGGAAKAVKYVLEKLNIPFLVVARKPSATTILYEEISPEILASHQLLVNTTPLGMSPNLDSAPPINYDLLTHKHLAYDLVYNPEETLFMSKVKAQGGKVKNGMEMLYLQAEGSWYIWNK